MTSATLKAFRRPVHIVWMVALLAASIAVPVTPAAAGPCDPPVNAIVCENSKPGNPASEWDVSGAGESSIQGYTTEFSVDQGETVRFKIDSDAVNYRLDIYRMGYYGGMGARKVATVEPSAALPQAQPNCLYQATTGLTDCGNWAVSASWPVPADAVSGIYFARLVREAGVAGASHAFFVVRDDDGASDLLFQTSDTTWQAYNDFGGNSLYKGQPANRAYKVSYNRPFSTRAATNGPRQSWVFNAEYPMVRWLERNGYDLSYASGIDTARRGAELLEHETFLSVGHDEYWSADQRANVEAARAAGVNLAFFSGNEVFWKTRWESSIDGTGTPYRTLVSYKETAAEAKIDPTAAWTGTWRDPRFSPPSDGGRPENALTGTLFMVNGPNSYPMSVPAEYANLRFWRNTSVASLQPGQSATLPGGIVGYEWDEDVDNGFRPPGLFNLSSTSIDVDTYLIDYGNTFSNGRATHALTLYRHASGALVFGAGTVQWSWGLDANHDFPGTPTDVRIQQATVNLLADMGAQPSTLQSGLVASSQSTDTTAPVAEITSPDSGSAVELGTHVISGTAADVGGVVSAVEVSTDGGATWHRATGRSNWSYTWPIPDEADGTSVTIKARAVDDSGNLQTSAVSSAITVGPPSDPDPSRLVAAYSFNEGSGSLAADSSGRANNGSLSGATWTNSGKYGRAVNFDGAGDVVTVPDSNSLDLTNGMTLEAWVRPSQSNDWRTIMLKEKSGGLAYSLYANTFGDRPSGQVSLSGTDREAAGNSPLPVGAWSHVAVSFNGARIRLFVNGAQVAGVDASGSMSPSTGALRIGGNNVWGEYFVGQIDEVRVYNRALSILEIQADMTSPIAADSVAPTAPGGLSAVGGIGAAGLSWSAATDNVGIAHYNVHRSTSAGFTPSAGNRIAQTSATTFGDSGLGAGTYHYRIVAEDSSGNLSPSSNEASATATTDSAPPTVAMSEPTEGATVTETVTLRATAADNVGVADVRFTVDGNPLGSPDATSPYSISWNSRSVANGPHVLRAIARDASNNEATSTALNVTVDNPALPGPVAAYSFNAGSGTSASDSSGKNNHGTIAGATWTTSGKFGKALSFDGAGDLVTVPDANTLDATTALTLEAWVRPTAIASWQTVMLKEASNSLAYGIYGSTNNSRPSGQIVISGSDHEARAPAQLAVGTWTHLASTYDGTTLRLYVNGTHVATKAVSGSMANTSGPFRMGGNGIWGEYFAGLIDEVRVYTRALGASEIQTDMSTPIDADSVAPTAPAGLAANGSIGAIALNWNAATDNSGIAHYNVHRSSAPGFTPSAGNRIAQPTSTSFNDTGLSAGTYHYLVTAEDASGNVGPVSNEASATATSDTTPPNVTISAPAGGSVVSDQIEVTAGASDNVAVAEVQFTLDGNNLGAPDQNAPYSVTWDTHSVANGDHVLRAIARDPGNNSTTSDPVTVTVTNTGPAGLVAAYSFDEGSGTAVADASGKNNNGVVAGAAWSASGKSGAALSFDGAGDWVTVADSTTLDLTDGMSLEAWVRPAALSGWQTVMLKETSGNLVYGMYGNTSANRPNGQIVVGGADHEARGTAQLAANTWTHMAATFDGASLKFFVNGAQVGSKAVTGSMTNSSGALRIGGNSVWGEHFTGLIDEVRVYNRALTAAQISTDMNDPIGL